MLKKCPICGGKIKLVQKKLLLGTPNPGQLLIETKCGECQNCGEDFFDENQADTFAREIDKEMKEVKKDYST